MKRIFVKPAKKGNVVLDELDRKIPADGMEVNATTFTRRLIKEGCLVELNKVDAKVILDARASNATKKAEELKKKQAEADKAAAEKKKADDKAAAEKKKGGK